MARNKMQCQIDELEQSVQSATEIFQSLALRQQVPSILQSLRDGDDWDTIARSIKPESTSASPDDVKLVDNRSPSFGGDQADSTSLKGRRHSITVPRHEDVPSSRSLRRGDVACDACKLRRQKCDGHRPACDTCQRRELQCKHANAPASKLQPSDFSRRSSTSIIQEKEELKWAIGISGRY